MKILKGIILVIVVVVAIALIAGLFVDGKYEVSREITINKPKQEVFAYLKQLKNHKEFGVWSKKDPDMKQGFEGEDGTVGAIVSWDSEHPEVGVGEQEIIKITENERLDLRLRFFKPWEDECDVYFITGSTDDNQTKVTWGFSGEMKFPMKLFMNMDEMVGPAYEEGLKNLKEILEAQSSSLPEISQEEVVSKNILFISESSALTSEEIGSKMGGAFGEILAFIQENELEMVGVPMSITNKFSIEDMVYDFDASIPVNTIENVTPSGRIKAATTYEGKVVKAIHVGSYESSMSTYDMIINYLKENKLDTNGRSWEEYINDPNEVKPEELITHIYFPIK